MQKKLCFCIFTRRLRRVAKLDANLEPLLSHCAHSNFGGGQLGAEQKAKSFTVRQQLAASACIIIRTPFQHEKIASKIHAPPPPPEKSARGNDVRCRPTQPPTRAFCRVEKLRAGCKNHRVIIPRNNMREPFILRAQSFESLPAPRRSLFPSFYIAHCAPQKPVL